MIKDCSTCDYCQRNKLNDGYVCENEDSPNYGDIYDWLDGYCDEWFDESEGTK
jgi:hypothetical protein